ncbi:uncharacterized protein [Watersipora subatra]|uniref:uncharacterized protein n=1 Tax=Watersipora subatra TaxID=2589382 RepID=UPI00355C6D5C
MENRELPLEDSQNHINEVFVEDRLEVSTPRRDNRTSKPLWSDYDSDSSDLEQVSTDEDKESENNDDNPLSISRRDLQRLESIMSTASMRSNRRSQQDEDLLGEADVDMMEFALRYAKDIIAQSVVKINEEDEGIDEIDMDNSALLDQIVDQQAEQRSM